MTKYALHPGFITSERDGDLHYIGVAQLARLYQLRPSEYIVWDRKRPETYQGREWNDYVHLYPSYRGNYGRPDSEAYLLTHPQQASGLVPDAPDRKEEA